MSCVQKLRTRNIQRDAKTVRIYLLEFLLLLIFNSNISVANCLKMITAAHNIPMLYNS